MPVTRPQCTVLRYYHGTTPDQALLYSCSAPAPNDMAGHNGACSSGGRLQASSARELANLDIRELATGCVLQLVELVEYKRGTPSAKNLSDTFSEDERVIREPQLLRSL